MSKLQKLFKGFILLLKKPSLINLITDSEYHWQQYLKKHHGGINQLPTVDIQHFLNSSSSLDGFTFLGGGSLPTDILLLASLAEKIDDCSYFEIGTWRGESVIHVSELADECYTLNLSKEEIIAEGYPEKYANLHAVLSKGKENITHIFGNSLHYDFAALNKKFDLIFVDGNHKYDFVKNDTEKVFANLIHEDSIVVWHDYATHPENPRPEVLAGILDGLPKGKRMNLHHVSNTLCAIYYPKEIESRLLDFPINPDKFFQLKMKIKEV